MTEQQPPSPYQPPADGAAPYAGYQPAYGQAYPYPVGYAYGYGNPVEQLLTPARRAMWLMLILGILTVLFGGCFSLVGAMWPQVVKQMPPESQAQFDRMQQQLQGVGVQTYLLVMGVATLVIGLLHVALSFLVRRGTMVPVVMGILMCGAMLLLLGLLAIGNAVSGQLVGICFGVVGLALWGLLLAWLIQAATRAGQVAAARGYGAAGAGAYGAQQYAAQYGQYQQQQQQPPLGYGFPPPPPPQQQQSPPGPSGYPPPPPPGAGPV
jgi:hypothetical protein